MAELTQRHIVTIIDLLKREEKRLISETDLPGEIAIARQYGEAEKMKDERLEYVRQLMKVLEEEINKTVYKFESVSFEKDYFERERSKNKPSGSGTMNLANYGLDPKMYGN